MYSLSDLYEKGSGSTTMTIIMGVVASLFFTTGLFLILSAHNNNQSRQVDLTLAALRRALSQSGNSSNSALLNLEAALAAQSGSKKGGPVTLPSIETLDNLTVRGTTTLQGAVRTSRDVTVGGNLSVNNNFRAGSDAEVEGDFSVLGTSEFNDNVSMAGELQVAGNAEIGGDVSASSLTLASDLFAEGDLEVSGNATFSGDLDVAGTLSVSTLSVGTLEGELTVTGATSLQDGLTVTGDTTTDTLTVNNDATMDGNVSIGGNLELTGRVVGGLNVEDVITLGTTGTTLTIAANNDNTAIDISGSVAMANSLSVGENLVVDGTSTLSSASITGNAQVDGDFLNRGNATIGSVDDQGQYLGGGDLTTYGDLILGGSVTYTLGPELITTTDFTNGAWTSGGWSTTTTTATHDIGNTSALSTGQISPTPSLKYQVNYTVSGTPAAASTLLVTLGGETVLNSSFSGSADGNITVSRIITASSSAGLAFTPSSTFNGAVSNVSVKEVTAISQQDSALKLGGSSSTLTIQATNNNSLIEVTGDLLANNNLTVGADLTVDDNITVNNGDLTLTNGSLVVSAGDLTVSGTASLGNVTASSLTTSGSTGLTIGNNGNIAIMVSGTPHNGDTFYDDSYMPNPVLPGGTVCSASEHIFIKAVERGIITAATCNPDSATSGYDLAENFQSNQSLEAGDVVSLDPANAEYVLKADAGNRDHAIGVVSTQPGYTLGVGDGGYPVALAGRVPVKVANESGPIAPGDYLTSSSTPGYAKKAAFGDKTVGQALTGLNDASGTVLMVVNVSSGNNNLQVGNNNFTSLNVSGPAILGDLEVTGLARVKDLQVTGLATIENLVVTGHIAGNDDTRGTVTIPAGQTAFSKTFNKPYSKAPAIVASPDNIPASFSATATNTGFEIKLAASQATDVKFNYLIQE